MQEKSKTDERKTVSPRLLLSLLPSSPLSVTRKRVARRVTKLTPPTLQHVRVDLQPACNRGLDQPANPSHHDREKSTLNSHATCLKLVDTLRWAQLPSWAVLPRPGAGLRTRCS